MANADRKHFGPGMQGKGDGTGALTDMEPEDIPANMVLSNRDKAQHSDDRGLDSRAVQTDQGIETAMSHSDVPEEELVDIAENPPEEVGPEDDPAGGPDDATGGGREVGGA